MVQSITPLPPSHYEEDSLSCLGALRKPKETCSSRNDYEECRLELAAVGATLALRLISLLDYVGIELPAFLGDV